MKRLLQYGSAIALVILMIRMGVSVQAHDNDAPMPDNGPEQPVEPRKYFAGKTREDVILYSKERDGSSRTLMRKAQLMRKANAPATIVVAHGFMCAMHDIAFLRSLFANYNTLVFDFRAHGEHTRGQCCSFGLHEAHDVVAAVEYLKAQPDLKNKPIIGYGFSMGAASLLHAQSKMPLFDGLVLDCPFESTENIIKRGIGNLKLSLFGYDLSLPGRGLLEKYAFHPRVQWFLKAILKTVAKMDATQVTTCLEPFSPEEVARGVDVPTFFIACKEDDKAPVEAVKAVYNNVQGFKRLWITNGRRHFDSFFFNPEKYAYKVDRFIKKVLSGRYAKKVQHKITVDSNAVQRG